MFKQDLVGNVINDHRNGNTKGQNLAICLYITKTTTLCVRVCAYVLLLLFLLIFVSVWKDGECPSVNVSVFGIGLSDVRDVGHLNCVPSKNVNNKK